MLTSEQLDEFRLRGFVRIRGAFARADAAAMEDVLWRALERRHGVVRDDPSTWEIPLASGLQTLRTHRVFGPIGGASTTGAIDSILGAGQWLAPKHWGQFLVTFPPREAADATWHVPTRIWHTDFAFWLPFSRICGALVISFIGDVPPRTGGTLVVDGSPQVIRHFLEARPQHRSPKVKMKVVRHALMQSDPWLAALVAKPADDPARVERFMRDGASIDGVPVRVTELVGEPGDVVLGHPWLLHCPAPNSGSQPRLMRVQRLRVSS